MTRDIALTVYGTLAGALLGWGLTHWYYVKALSDMRADAQERERLSELILRGIESVGTIRYARDPAGRVLGITIELRAEGKAAAAGDAALTVGPSTANVK